MAADIMAMLLNDLNEGVRIKPSDWVKSDFVKALGISRQKVDATLTRMTRDGVCECYAGTYFIRKSRP